MSPPPPPTPHALLTALLPRLTSLLPPSPPPLIIGISGPQGSGKSTLAHHVHTLLTSPPYSLRTAILSIDDLYLPHAAQVQLAASHPTNPLLQHRGNPGTHDLVLAKAVLEKLRKREAVDVPRYDKSAFGGAGDRGGWERVEEGTEVVVVEGWCLGFRAKGEVQGHLGTVDEFLKGYEVFNEAVDIMVHLDAEDINWVYEWRLEQEKNGKQGMTEEQVRKFVDGYMPAYREYLPELRKGFKKEGKQVRIRLGRQREVLDVEKVEYRGEI